jgi:hypothetical protein
MSRLQAVNDPRQKLNTTGTFATLGAATLYDGEEAQQRPPPIANIVNDRAIAPEFAPKGRA